MKGLITVTEMKAKYNLPTPIAQALYSWGGEQMATEAITPETMKRLCGFMQRACKDMQEMGMLDKHKVAKS